MQFFDGFSYPSGNIGQGFITVRPTCNGPGIFGQGLELAEGATPPIDFTEDDGDHSGLFGFVPLQGLLHFRNRAIVRLQKICADEKEDDVGRLQVGIDLTCPLLPWRNPTIMPTLDEAEAPHRAQVRLKLIAQVFVFVRIGIEDLDGC